MVTTVVLAVIGCWILVAVLLAALFSRTVRRADAERRRALARVPVTRARVVAPAQPARARVRATV